VTSPRSEYVSVAGRPWQERRPGVHWKVLHEEGVADDTGTCKAGDHARRPPGCVHTVHSPGGALVLAVMTGGTEAVPDPGRA
jgi:hypothetical protein